MRGSADGARRVAFQSAGTLGDHPRSLSGSTSTQQARGIDSEGSRHSTPDTYACRDLSDSPATLYIFVFRMSFAGIRCPLWRDILKRLQLYLN